ncbi:MAG: heparin lyase I family protein [Myxococcaceae bacterium]|nr:heparin lyase I family protein [Myxococcaceae bacterium]
MRRLPPIVLVLLATVSSAQVTWRGDFETSNTSQFNYLLNPTITGRPYLSVVRDVVASGTFAGRIELHDDARWSNGLRRVEVQHSPAMGRTAAGATLCFGWSFLVPQPLPRSPEQTIGYWESNTSYQQLMAFAVIGNDLRFSTNRPTWRAHWTGQGVVTPGVWHRIAMCVLWSTDPMVGTVDVWFDGAQVVRSVRAQTLADANSAFVQMGLLRGNLNFADVPVIYLDDALEGLRPGDVQPVAPDGGTMPVDGGAPVDAGVRPDAGLPGDAGAPFDAGAPQGDAGLPPSSDGGTGTDSDAGDLRGPETATGCSCGLGGEGWALLALVALVTRRRQHEVERSAGVSC